jgi:hypothetical protein
MHLAQPQALGAAIAPGHWMLSVRDQSQHALVRALDFCHETTMRFADATKGPLQLDRHSAAQSYSGRRRPAILGRRAEHEFCRPLA